MREIGIVTAIHGDTVTVAMASATHSKCTSCGMCRAASEGGQMLMDVPAAPNLNVGDRVCVEIPVPGAGTSAALLLLLPMVAFLLGLGLGEWLRGRGALSGGSGVSVLIGLAAMALCYTIAALYDRHLRTAPEHRPRIVDDATHSEKSPSPKNH